ncbi:MAG: carbohydrate ABC transporter permease [Roseiflexaceae bacterium]
MTKFNPIKIVSYMFMVLAILMIGMPLLWMLLASFKETQEIYRMPPTWFPENPTLANYPAAWNAVPFDRYFFNSMVTTLAATTSKVVLAMMCAYALVFTKAPQRLKDGAFLIILAALMVPAQVTIVPNYITMAEFNWVNTYQGIVLPNAATAFGTFLLRQYCLSLPGEVVEAAEMDGASHFQRMWLVVLPMTQPALVTVGLFAVVSEWNDFLWPLIITNTDSMRTLPIGVFRLFQTEGLQNWGVIMAGTVFVVAPVIALFIRTQKWIVDGIAAGAVRG